MLGQMREARAEGLWGLHIGGTFLEALGSRAIGAVFHAAMNRETTTGTEGEEGKGPDQKPGYRLQLRHERDGEHLFEIAHHAPVSELSDMRPHMFDPLIGPLNSTH